MTQIGPLDGHRPPDPENAHHVLNGLEFSNTLDEGLYPFWGIMLPSG